MWLVTPNSSVMELVSVRSILFLVCKINGQDKESNDPHNFAIGAVHVLAITLFLLILHFQRPLCSMREHFCAVLRDSFHLILPCDFFNFLNNVCVLNPATDCNIQYTCFIHSYIHSFSVLFALVITASFLNSSCGH